MNSPERVQMTAADWSVWNVATDDDRDDLARRLCSRECVTEYPTQFWHEQVHVFTAIAPETVLISSDPDAWRNAPNVLIYRQENDYSESPWCPTCRGEREARNKAEALVAGLRRALAEILQEIPKCPRRNFAGDDQCAAYTERGRSCPECMILVLDLIDQALENP